ncbi:ANTAR domain-containing protein [Amycolatopsis oliviviridis]|uniref:ANTAR domain-containing protein n=1 Tax=Amycolatopsis oliviviridis TaxID=1471590 RepID=A0ABQ3LZG3_9PSEU|nr:GAF and ANTAR domain-containing protein [Amycolatopsis oliviviridis]GHH28613.1 hypothetical protein GCM10017790_59730 [Amycolatopsis oliviviridis]
MDGLRRDRLWQVVTERAGGSWPEAGWVGVVCSVAGECTEADGAAISLRAQGDRQELVAFTDDWSSHLEELQFTVGEGPAAEAYATGGPVLVSDLAFEEYRWPGFTDGAAEHGLRAVFAFPLQVGAILLGTLSLYRRVPEALGVDALGDALILADIATSALVSDASSVNGPIAPWARMEAEGHYDDVNIATGMLAAELGISLGEALLRLRAHAFSHRIPITEVARMVMNRQLRFDTSAD